MYKELTPKARLMRRLNRIAAVLVVAILGVALWMAFLAATAHTTEQGANSIRQTVLDSAMQCCAIEGSYPPSIEYLEEHYGLNVNQSDYVIFYEIFASNIAPSVMVVPR